MPIPRDPAPDSTLALLREGYAFVRNRCQRWNTDAFETRLMLSRCVCLLGEEAAREFYQPGRFTRVGAIPAPSFSLIQDFGSVMALTGRPHRHRKALFLRLLRPEALGDLPAVTERHFLEAARGWRGEVDLFAAAHAPLCAAIAEWAGLSPSPAEVATWASDFHAMVEGTGGLARRMVRGQIRRAVAERRFRRIIRDIRAARLPVPEDSAAAAMAHHRDEDGQLLSPKVAAVELINILRPTVANARYALFIAMALHAHPEWRNRIAASEEDLSHFVQEVRRFYPFIPVMGGRALERFTFRGRDFAPGDWVLLDLWGTQRDARAWGDGDAFRPDRFRQPVPEDAFVTQGAGNHAETHRCPGEWVTIEQMKVMARLLATRIAYDVLPGDHALNLARLPVLPREPFRIRLRG
jgi:fatty-acid peroxygenase